MVTPLLSEKFTKEPYHLDLKCDYTQEQTYSLYLQTIENLVSILNSIFRDLAMKKKGKNNFIIQRFHIHHVQPAEYCNCNKISIMQSFHASSTLSKRHH